MTQISVCQSQSKLSQNHLTHVLIQLSVIASNWCVRGQEMKLLQNIVLGVKKLNCFKATQVWGGPTQILIWGSEIAKGPTRYIKVGPGALISRGT